MSFTYKELNEYLGKKNEKLIKKSQMQTWARRMTDENICIRLGETWILDYYQDGRIYLDAGVWKTRTTMMRMNEYLPLPWKVFQRRSIWWLWNYETKKEWPFANNICIQPDGTVIQEGENPQAQQKLIKKINRYANDFMEALVKGEVPAPSGGDCWHCSMREAAGEIKTGVLHEDGSLTNQAQVGPGLNGRTLGELNGNTGHIFNHIKEKYYVSSLLMRAIEVNPISRVGMRVLGSLWQEGAEPIESMHSVFKDQAGKSLKKYIKSQLGIAR